MGIHTGEPLVAEDHYVGIDVHRGARIAAAAYGGQVLISARTRALLQEDGATANVPLRELGAYPLKDLPEPESLFQLVVDGLPATFPPPRVDEKAPAAAGLPDYSLPPADVPCPYKGLVRFESEDTDLFFGREELVSELAKRLADSSFLAVVGPSGSGKSSLVRAGVVPELEWREASIRPAIIEPGEHPLAKLAGTQDADLVVVDQFEEVFTLCRDEEERVAFVERLLDAAEQGHRVVAVLRADFYGHCASYSRLVAALEDGHALIGPMTEEELRRAIERPAERAGLVLEPGLAEGILRDIVGEPGALPLLSHSLLETWRRRSDRMLTLLGYLQSGGVRGAIAKTAETVYQQALTPAQQTLARNIFLRLTELGEGTEDTRRRVRLGELTPRREQAADVEDVLSVLVEARLVTTGEGTVEVAHEALIRHWPTLRAWLDEDREGRLTHRHLTEAAREWHTLGNDPGALYRGARLAAATDWAELHDDELNELEREFLGTSREAELSEVEATKRRNRRLRMLVAALAVILVGALAAGAFALVQRSDAQHKARVALARQLGAQAVSEPRIDRAMLLARQAVDLDRSRATEGTLLATLLRSPTALSTFTTPIDSRPQKVVLSPDGRTLAVSDNNNAVRLYDTATHRLRHVLKNVGDTASVTYTPDGSAFVAFGGTNIPTVELIDATTFKRLRTFRLDRQWLSVPTGGDAPLVVTPDGRSIFYVYNVLRPDTTPPDGPAFVDRWNLRTGKLVSTTPVGADGAFSASLIDHGRRLAVGGTEAVTILDAGTLRRVRTAPLPSGANPVSHTAVSPNGRTAAVGTVAGSVSFVDLASGRVTPGLGGHSTFVQGMEFSPDGRVLVTTSDDGTVIVWDPARAQAVERLIGHGGRVHGLTLSADGSTLYTNSLDGAIFEWDLGNRRRFGRLFKTMVPAVVPALGPDAENTPPLAISPDGSEFAVRVGLSKAAVYSTDTGRRRSEFTPTKGGEVIGMAWSRKGLLAVNGDRGYVELWDVSRRPRLVRSLKGLGSINKEPEAVTTVDFSPDGRLVAAGDINHTPGGTPYRFGSVAVWDADSGKLLWKSRTKHGWVSTVMFSPDGRTIAGAREDGVVLLYDARTGGVRRALHLQGSGFAVAAFAADGTLATGSWTGIVQLWNPATGAQVGHSTLVAAAPVASIDFDPSGDTFVTTGGSDGVMKLWTTKTQQQFGATFPGSPGTWGNAAYTPDGSRIVVVYADGTGSVWPATVGAWEDHACRVAGRNFTREEWSRFVTGRGYSGVCPSYPAG
jgi:WD40 repeat protein